MRTLGEAYEQNRQSQASNDRVRSREAKVELRKSGEWQSYRRHGRPITRPTTTAR
jgi:hypothetical protein